jgi:hypothetical protein
MASRSWHAGFRQQEGKISSFLAGTEGPGRFRDGIAAHRFEQQFLPENRNFRGWLIGVSS